ncbi:MAG: hypothetical protein AAB914_02050 [Patescibacteria group bacterium]
MSRNDRSLEFEPHFQLIASGEFQAGCDPEQGFHTLEKLAIATYNKGEKILNSNRYVYTPSWAENYVCEVIYVPNNKNKLIVNPRMVELHGPQRNLSIHDDEEHLMLYTDGFKVEGEALLEKYLIVDSEEDITLAKDLVTLAVKAFFATQPPRVDLTVRSGQV